MKPIHICHIIFRLDYGGLENGLVNLINNLPAESYRHSILSLKPASDFSARLRSDNVQVSDVGKRDGKDVSVYAKVWKLLRALRPDIVHTRNIATLDLLGPAFFSGCRALVHGEHGLDMSEIDGKHRNYNRLRRLSRLVTRRYIAVSADLARWLETEIGVPRGKVTQIYNGVDTDRFSPQDVRCADLPEGFAAADRFVVGSIGRLAPVKDHFNLATAFCLLADARPELRDRLRLVIVGDGPSKPECQAVVDRAGLTDMVWMSGAREDVVDCYNSFDLFVLPSRREGISNTALEAMSCGLPIVATGVGGTPEIVPDGKAGTLVPPGDPRALAEVIGRYFDDRDLLAAHGRTARSHAESTFALPKMVSQYDAVYRALVSG